MGAINMKISDIDSDAKLVDFENFLEVHENHLDSRKPYVFNLNESIYFDGIPQLEYKVSHDMFWTTLSYEIYKTPRLWWVLMKVNGVKAEDTFDTVKAGSTVKYMDQETVRSILTDFIG